MHKWNHAPAGEIMHLISIDRRLGISLEELESVGRRTSNILL